MIKYIIGIILIIALYEFRLKWWLVAIILGLGSFGFIFESPIIEPSSWLLGEWGLDFIGFRLIILSFWVRMLIILSSSIIKETNFFSNYFVWLVLGLILILYLCFISLNLIYFYFFFEVSLIPTLLIIIGWGLQLERLQAGVYFIFYTLTASLPLLLNLCVCYWKVGDLLAPLILINVKESLLAGVVSFIIIIRLIIAFLVKLPVFFVHLWLPKAHVEAPVAGSIILAGVLLKLGGFGLRRVIPLVFYTIFKYRGYIVGLGVIRIVYVGFICLRLNDLKALVAYSSVAHIGLVFSGLVTIYRWGIRGGLIIIISHGLSSSGLFCAVNIFYERLGSRRIYFNKGLLLIFSSLRLLVFILCAANISAPPTINLMAEFFFNIKSIDFQFNYNSMIPVRVFFRGSFYFIFIFLFTTW